MHGGTRDEPGRGAHQRDGRPDGAGPEQARPAPAGRGPRGRCRACARCRPGGRAPVRRRICSCRRHRERAGVRRGQPGRRVRGGARRPRRCALRSGGARRRARRPRSRRRGWRSARRARGAARRARRRGPGRDAGARPATARRLPRPDGCPRRGGGAAGPRARPAASSAAATSASLAPRRPTRTLSATERAKRCGRCGTQPMPAAPARRRSRSRRSTPPSRTWPEPGRRSPRTTSRRVDLPHPLGPTSATVSPGSTTSAAPSSAGMRRSGYVTSSPVMRMLVSCGRTEPPTPTPSVTGVSSSSKTCSAALMPSALAWKFAPRARRGR